MLSGDMTLAEAIAKAEEMCAETMSVVGSDMHDKPICAVVIITGKRTGQLIAAIDAVIEDITGDDDEEED